MLRKYTCSDREVTNGIVGVSSAIFALGGAARHPDYLHNYLGTVPLTISSSTCLQQGFFVDDTHWSILPMATSNTQSGLGQHRPIAIAPTANGLSGPQDEAAATPSMPYTCVTCARRKVRCDKTGPPCSTCQKGRHQCHYEAPAPRKRKRKPVDDVQEKLEEYEDLLKQHGLISRSEKTPSEETLSSIGTTAAPLKGQPTPENQTGKLLAGRGKTRYIDSTLWRALGEEELHPSSDEEDDVDDESGQPKADLSPLNIDPVSAAMYGHASPSRNLIELHPSYETAMKFWDMYVSCVEPVVKTFHVPTGRAMVQRAASNPSSIPKTVECLLFAVYHFAVVAMTDDECAEITSQPRGQLQTIYQDAVRQGLVNVYFLRTTDMNVLHAYVLFLLSARNTYDPHTFWILTGVAVRISQRIGLHRDGEELGLKPFDVEMRRRLFWQLPRLDVYVCVAPTLLPAPPRISPTFWLTLSLTIFQNGSADVRHSVCYAARCLGYQTAAQCQ